MSEYATHERGAYASPLRRLAAVLIDGLLIGVVMAGVLIPLWIAAQDRDDLIPIVLGAYLVLLAAAVLYEVALVARRGATLGKQLMRIQVRGADGELPSLAISFVRYFTKFLSAAVALLGLLWALWEPRRRGWHDMIAGTVVLHARRVTDAAAGLDRERDRAPAEVASAQIAPAQAAPPGLGEVVRARDASAGEAPEARSDEQTRAAPSEPDFELAREQERPVQAQAQPEPGEAADHADESLVQPGPADSPAPAERGEAAGAAAGDMSGDMAEPIETGQQIGQVEAGQAVDQLQPVEPDQEPSQPAPEPEPEDGQPAAAPEPEGVQPAAAPEPEGVQPAAAPEPEGVQPAAAPEPEGVQPAAAPEPEGAQPAAATEPIVPADAMGRPTGGEPADEAPTAPEEPAAAAASAAQPSVSGEPSAPAAAAAVDQPPPTEPAPTRGGGADPNVAAIADAQLAPESAGWLRQVADQVDPRLDQVTAGWRALPQSEAARACVFGLLLGHLANTYPHMAADLSRAAERHVSFSTFGSGSRLAILQDIAADPTKIAAWIGPLIGVEDPQQVRRLLA